MLAKWGIILVIFLLNNFKGDFMKKVFLVCSVIGLFCAGFTACSSAPRAAETKAHVSDHDSALTELASASVDVCLANTVYITNRNASVLAPKLQAGQPVTCELAHVALVAPRVTHKEVK